MIYPKKKLGEICDINPVKSEIKDFPDGAPVSFVPMSAVSEITQRVENQEERKLGEVKKGYTYFKRGDILFAKITPCMENGKVALADNIKNQVGFASTEFHVIRASENILPEYVFHLVASEKFRNEAQTKMTGSAGQKRVPKTFLENYEIPLPPIGEQKKIVAKLEKVLWKIEEAKKLRGEAESATATLLPAELHKIFSEGKKKGWEEKSFKEVLIFKTGKLDSNASVAGGKYPFFTCAQQTYAIDSYSFDQKAVLLAGNNAAGKYSVKYYDGKFDAYQRTYIISTKDEKQLDYMFLKNYISHILNDLRDLSVGVNTKFLTMKVLDKIKIPLPPLTEQKKIVARLDSLSAKIQKLQEYQKTTANDLVALEQSILAKAFNS